MAVPSWLAERRWAIADRWLREALTSYSDEAARAFERNQDRFANPVGHALRSGTQAAVEALFDGRDAQAVSACLEDAIKIRAVQQFAPSEALRFVFLLKDAIRAVWDAAPHDVRDRSELVELEDRIDQIALRAFDMFMGYRERVYELRLNEVKRTVPVLVERFYARYGETPPAGELVELERPERTATE